MDNAWRRYSMMVKLDQFWRWNLWSDGGMEWHDLRVCNFFIHFIRNGILFFQAACEVWSETLWVKFNPEALLDGMETFIQELRCFNEAVMQLPVVQFLDVYMKQFKKSVLLFVKLKNEALKERHWTLLMDKTGLCLSYLTHSYTQLEYVILLPYLHICSLKIHINTS